MLVTEWLSISPPTPMLETEETVNCTCVSLKYVFLFCKSLTLQIREKILQNFLFASLCHGRYSFVCGGIRCYALCYALSYVFIPKRLLFRRSERKQLDFKLFFISKTSDVQLSKCFTNIDILNAKNKAFNTPKKEAF